MKLKDLPTNLKIQAATQLAGEAVRIIKRNKYNAQKAEAPQYRELAGRSFHSQAERNRAVELVMLQRTGVIGELIFQPRYFLSDALISYHADFEYIEDGQKVTEEYKGFADKRWGLIQRLWRAYALNKLKVTRYKGKRLYVIKEIMPKKT